MFSRTMKVLAIGVLVAAAVPVLAMPIMSNKKSLSKATKHSQMKLEAVTPKKASLTTKHHHHKTLHSIHNKTKMLSSKHKLSSTKVHATALSHLAK